MHYTEAKKFEIFSLYVKNNKNKKAFPQQVYSTEKIDILGKTKIEDNEKLLKSENPEENLSTFVVALFMIKLWGLYFLTTN